MFKNTFQPNWATPPGETISDILQERNLSLHEFARQLGYTSSYTNKLLNGNESITNEVAQKLEYILGASKSFWLNRESQYRMDIVRLQNNSQDWLKMLPVKDMIKFGWINSFSSIAEKEKVCLQFFDIANIYEWNERYQSILMLTAFRTSGSFDSKAEAVITWIRQGEILAKTIKCQPWNSELLKKTLPKLRSLTRIKDPEYFIPKLQELCAKCGVAIAIIPAPTGCRASGATLFIKPTKALLLLSFRYLSDDHFWFSFFHEIGHLILHENILFLEGVDNSDTQKEKEANDFAANILIPEEHRKEFLTLSANKWRDIIRFASKIDISPGIVVGQLQKLGILPYGYLNKLKTKFEWDI